MTQLTNFMPHLRALSCSSPFWQGRGTELDSYRLTVFDNLPGSGLPLHMNSFSEFERSVTILVDLGVIEDSSKIWWDLRPSHRYPTLESRICDVSPRLEDTLTIAALTQCLTRMLWRLSSRNQRWRIYDRFLLGENRWRAQRYGVSDGQIDFGRKAMIPFAQAVDEILDLVAEDAAALDCVAEVAAARKIVQHGTSADHQRSVRDSALASGATQPEAMAAVVASLIADFHADL